MSNSTKLGSNSFPRRSAIAFQVRFSVCLGGSFRQAPTLQLRRQEPARGTRRRECLQLSQAADDARAIVLAFDQLAEGHAHRGLHARRGGLTLPEIEKNSPALGALVDAEVRRRTALPFTQMYGTQP